MSPLNFILYFRLLAQLVNTILFIILQNACSPFQLGYICNFKNHILYSKVINKDILIVPDLHKPLFDISFQVTSDNNSLDVVYTTT